MKQIVRDTRIDAIITNKELNARRIIYESVCKKAIDLESVIMRNESAIRLKVKLLDTVLENQRKRKNKSMKAIVSILNQCF